MRLPMLLLAAVLPIASAQAQEPWGDLYGSWQAEDGRTLTIGPDGLAATGAEGWDIADPVVGLPGRVADGTCQADFAKQRGAALAERYRSTLQLPGTAPEALAEVLPDGSYYVLRITCGTDTHDWILTQPDRLLLLGVAEGWAAPVLTFARADDAAAPAQGDAADDAVAYQAVHRDWSIACGPCIAPGRSLCSIRTLPVGAAPADRGALVVYGDPGGGLAIGLASPSDNEGGSMALDVDGGAPVVLAADAGVDETVLRDPAQVADLIAAFRRGLTASLALTQLRTEGEIYSYSLLGFSAALQDMLRATATDAPACPE